MSLLLALSLLLQKPPQNAPSATGVIEGVVLTAGTNEPIEGVRVILASARWEEGNPSAISLLERTWRESLPSSSVSTDGKGRFQFKGLAANLYRLAFERNGYVRQEYGQSLFFGSGTPLDITEGRRIEDLVVHLTRTGSISGRILDANKQPVANVPVQVILPRYTPKGERKLESLGGTLTDDHGEYRLHSLTPGRYYLRAGTPQGSNGEFNAVRPNPNEVPAAYATRYYPGVADLGSAAQLDLKPASDMTGLDMTLPPQRLFRLHGRIIDEGTGQAPAKISLTLLTEPGSGMGQFGEDMGTYEDGIFEFHDLLPGHYWLLASFPNPAAPMAAAGRTSLNIVDSDLDGLTVLLSKGGSISGRIRFENVDTPPPEYFKDNPPWLTPTGRDSPQGDTRADVNPDGTFQIRNVSPGEYIVWLPPGLSVFYIKEARLDGLDVLGEPLRFNGGDADSLEILLGSDYGNVEGVLSDGKGPVAGRVVLVPNRMRNHPELFRTALTSQDGRFHFDNVVPGDYKVFAWEEIEPYAWFDPKLLARDEDRSQLVHIEKASTQTIEVRPIGNDEGSVIRPE